MAKRTVGGLFFEGFELLDIFGPLEMFGVLPQHFELVTLGESTAPIASAQGPRVVVDRTFDDAGALDVLLVPGGIGTRKGVENARLLDFLRATYPRLEVLASISQSSARSAQDAWGAASRTPLPSPATRWCWWT